MTEDEEGARVAARMSAFDWGKFQAAIAEGLKGGAAHKLEMEVVAPGSVYLGL